MKTILLASTILCAAGVMLAPTVQAAPPVYKQAMAIAIGSPERWDYLSFDQQTNRLFVSHGDRVDVLDGRTGAILGKVSGIPGGTHGIGIVHAVNKGYTDDGKAGEVVVFSLNDFKVLSRIKGKEDADGIAFDPKSGHIFVVDGDSAVLSVVDPAQDKIVATIAGGGGLEFAVADGRGNLYVNGADKRELLRIDTASNKVDASWPIPNCQSAHGLSIDTESHRLFVSCVNKLLTVVNGDSGAVVAELPIGAGTDASAFDPKRKLVFSSNGVDGNITVIHEDAPDKYSALGEIRTGVTARTMTLDPITGRLYVAMAAIDPTAPVPPGPNGRPGRPKPLPGSLKILFLDPQ